jgi:hypothetical protein
VSESAALRTRQPTGTESERVGAVVWTTDTGAFGLHDALVSQLSGNERIRISPAIGAFVALEIAIPMGFVILAAAFFILSRTGGSLVFGDPAAAVVELAGWLTLCCSAACAAAWIITTLTNRSNLNRPARIVLFAMLTKLLAVLLMPVVLAIWSAPAAMNGGPMPCFHIDSSCQSGLYGPDAIAGLVGAAVSWYGVGVFMLIPGFTAATLLLPAALWDKLVTARANSTPRPAGLASSLG